MAEAQEKELKACHLALNKASQTVGEGATLHHLRILKELLESETRVAQELILRGKTLTVSYGMEEI